VKLPRSVLFARAQTFVRPMGYGMDRSGWVSAHFGARESVPLDLLLGWVDESYESVAATALPKRPARAKAATAKQRPAASAPKRR
jgi:predicted DNA-binding protein (MmcQ/YjbR family)